jgi:hypothetical protein
VSTGFVRSNPALAGRRRLAPVRTATSFSRIIQTSSTSSETPETTWGLATPRIPPHDPRGRLAATCIVILPGAKRWSAPVFSRKGAGPWPTAAFLSGILAFSVLSGVSLAEPIRPEFVSRGADEAGIRTLLDNYTRAVSAKDRTLFESLLLNKTIPFSSAGAAVRAGGSDSGTKLRRVPKASIRRTLVHPDLSRRPHSAGWTSRKRFSRVR